MFLKPDKRLTYPRYPKGENAAVTARVRAGLLNQAVHVINPWGEFPVEVSFGTGSATSAEAQISRAAARAEPAFARTLQPALRAVIPKGARES
jgi:hypothetical protein